LVRVRRQPARGSLKKIVFHGKVPGCSHPDVAAKRALAVLFDEGTDLADSLIHSQNGLSLDLRNAYSGNRSLLLNLPRDRQDAAAAPLYRDRFGHTIPNWDVEIVEQPQPGHEPDVLRRTSLVRPDRPRSDRGRPAGEAVIIPAKSGWRRCRANTKALRAA